MANHYLPSPALLRRLNGWMKAELVINTLFLLALTLAFDRQLGTLKYVLMPIGCLVYVGAFLIQKGQTRFGTALFIAGSIVFIPLGGIGVIGALTLRHDLEDAERLRGLPIDFDETPAYTAMAVNGTQLNVMGAVSSIAGVFLMMFSGFQGAILISVGLLNFALAAGLQTVPAAAIFRDYARLRVSATRWNYVHFANLLEVAPPENEGVTIRYKEGEIEKKQVLHAKIYGAEQLNRLFSELQQRIQPAT